MVVKQWWSLWDVVMRVWGWGGVVGLSGEGDGHVIVVIGG
jgi:hypothetical protein